MVAGKIRFLWKVFDNTVYGSFRSISNIKTVFDFEADWRACEIKKACKAICVSIKCRDREYEIRTDLQMNLCKNNILSKYNSNILFTNMIVRTCILFKIYHSLTIGLSGKFVPTNLYNLINVLKFKSSAFQFSKSARTFRTTQYFNYYCNIKDWFVEINVKFLF